MVDIRHDIINCCVAVFHYPESWFPVTLQRFPCIGMRYNIFLQFIELHRVYIIVDIMIKTFVIPDSIMYNDLHI